MRLREVANRYPQHQAARHGGLRFLTRGFEARCKGRNLFESTAGVRGPVGK